MVKKYDSKQTIETILSVSSKLFVEKGFDKTSMQDIVNMAGISKGAIYHHFKSKEEIIKAVMERQSSNIEGKFGKLLDEIDSLNAKEKMIYILDKNLEDLESHSLDDILSSYVKSPEFVLSYMQDCVNKSAPIFSKLIQDGIKDASITTEFPEECAEVFSILINIWCDPAILPCDETRLVKRLKFLQYMMKTLGVDIISDDLLLKMQQLLMRLYSGGNK